MNSIVYLNFTSLISFNVLCRLVSYHLPHGTTECISGFYPCGGGGDCAKSDDHCAIHLEIECERGGEDKFCREPGKEGCLPKSGFCQVFI